MNATSLDAQLRAAGLDWIVPPLPCARARGLVTTRSGGVSAGEYGTMNLARHAGDDPDAVAENRRRLQVFLPSPPIWLEQVHGATVAVLDGAAPAARIVADAAVTRTRGVVLAVQTADCLPVLFADRNGTAVGIAHAGWRGLAAGVLEATVRAHAGARRQRAGRRRLDRAGESAPRAFEVGADVHAAFCERRSRAPHPRSSRTARGNGTPIFACARAARLAAAGVGAVTGGGFCTHDDRARFFSYRRAPLARPDGVARLARAGLTTGRS